MTSPDPLGKLLRFDPLAEVERILYECEKDARLTGTSIHDPVPVGGMNEATAVGFFVMQKHAAIKEAALRDRGDTMLCNELGRYLDIIDGAGFEHVWDCEFQHYPAYRDRYFIYARRDGLLLAFDSHGGEKTVNSGNVYYNWRPAKSALRNHHTYLSSGGWCRASAPGPITPADVWCGHHDCREALIYNIDRLAANGEFVCPWVERPFLWLLNYAEPKATGYNHEAITRARIAALPKWVQEFIRSEAENIA